MKHHKSGHGKHRAVKSSAVAAGTFSLLVAATFANGGLAVAAPQPGITGPAPVQPGVTSPAPSTPTVPAPSPSVPEAPAEAWVPVPPQYSQPTKPIPNWDYDSNQYVAPATPTYTPPIDYSQIRLPADPITTPTEVFIAPRNTVMVGNLHFTQPNWMSDNTTARTNATTNAALAAVTDFWISHNIPADQAQQLAAAQLAGTAGGAIAAAVSAGATAATLGALVGGTIGGTSGVVLAAPALTPWGVIPAGVVATAAGAAIGAGLAGVPVAVGAGIVGGIAGFALATAYGDGTNGVPTTIDVPDIDQPAITTETQDTLTSWEQSGPVGTAAATFVRDTAANAPVVDAQIRSAVSSIPGGDGVVAAFDQAVSDFQTATEVPGLPLGMIADAIGAGIPAAA
ncbi:insoluble domain protein [Rhodococcus erythropolis]|uniref:insoluble domain protein n=1 Tax=Rhodococcus erythropolis TaxID=1833 RepID=UPI0040437E68